MLNIRFNDKTKQYPVEIFREKKRPTFFYGYLESDMKEEVLDLSDYNSKSMDLLYYLYAIEDYELKDIKYYIENIVELHVLADFLLMDYVLHKVNNAYILQELLSDRTDKEFLASLPDYFIEVKEEKKCKELFLQIIKLKYEDFGIKFYIVNKIILDKFNSSSTIAFNIFLNNCGKLHKFIKKNKECESKILAMCDMQYLSCLHNCDLIYEDGNWFYHNHAVNNIRYRYNKRLVESIIRDMSSLLCDKKEKEICYEICCRFKKYPSDIIIKFIESLIVNNKLINILKHQNINDIISYIIKDISEEKVAYWLSHEMDDISRTFLENLFANDDKKDDKKPVSFLSFFFKK